MKKLKRRQGKDIYLGGGGELCRSFLQEDLVDELYLGLGPVLLGDGIQAFPPKFPQRNFRLTECKYYSNGSVGLRYERVRTKTRRCYGLTPGGIAGYVRVNCPLREDSGG